MIRLFLAAGLVSALLSGCGGGGGSKEPSGTVTAGVVYTYDELNRLTNVCFSDGNVVTYTYDDAGNIVSSEVRP